MMRKIINKNLVSVCNIKTSNDIEDPKLSQIPAVNIKRCNFEDFPNKFHSKRNFKPFSIVTLQSTPIHANIKQKRTVTAKTNKNFDNISVSVRKPVIFDSKDVEDSKLSQIPVVKIERCNFEGFPNKFHSKRNSKPFSTETLQSTPIHANIEQKRTVTAKTNKNFDNISVSVRKPVIFDFKDVEDSKLSQIPVVKIERCNFEGFPNKFHSKRNSKPFSTVTLQSTPIHANIEQKRTVTAKTNKNFDNISVSVRKPVIFDSKDMEDSKLSQIPVVKIERCNFEDFPNKFHSKRNSKPFSTVTLQSTPIHANIEQKRTVTAKTNKNFDNISVSVRKPVIFDQEDMGGKNYQTKKKKGNVNWNIEIKSTTQQENPKNIKTKEALECLYKQENRNERLISELQNNNKILRERKKVNYKEKLSIGTPDFCFKPAHPNGERIPIYKQLDSFHESSTNGRKDLYDFIPDSDEEKGSDYSFHLETPAKKRKVVKMLHNHRKRGNDVNNKENHLKKNNKGCILKYQDKIQNVLCNINNKINEKNNTNIKSREGNLINQNNQDNQKKNSHTLIKNSITNNKLIFTSTPEQKPHNLRLPDESPVTFNKGRIQDIENMLMQQDRNNEFMKETSNTQKKLSHREFIISQDEAHSNRDSISIIENESTDRNQDKVDDLFGFLEDIQEENKKKTPVKSRINIIQNIQLRESIISNRRIQSEEQHTRNSWRFSENITRNPHFVKLKNDGLPSLNQDPILDYTFDDRISEVNTITLVPHNKNVLKQQSILNFVKSCNDHFNENHSHTSLFDVEEYSPIKVYPYEKENSDRIQVVKRTRRNVLGEINENILAGKMSTPANSKNLSVPLQIDISLVESEKERDLDISNHFGFHSCSEIEENENIEVITRNKAKPFRLEVNYRKNKQPKELSEKLIQPVRDSVVKKIVGAGEDPEFSKLIESEGLESERVGLFEEADMSKNITKCYKARTKQKFVSTHDNPKRKDKGCKLSKEAKKWIKEFNQMCDEIENEELDYD